MFIILHPIKNNNNKLVTCTDEKLNVWHSHYKFLGLDSSSHRLSIYFWKDSYVLWNFGNSRQQELEINKNISYEEIREVISSSPNFKACGSNGISMKFFKALIPCKDDSEEFMNLVKIIVIFSLIFSSSFKCLKALFNRIWNGDIPK